MKSHYAAAPVITIDGPTASGKGTVAHKISIQLGFHYLDSGALYRLCALCALRRKVNLDDEHTLAKLAENLNLHFEGEKIFLADEDVSQLIRAEEVGNIASKIAAIQPLRQALYGLQLRFRKAPGLVADGRDMGSVIFPNAVVKVFLTASVQERAQRRYKQLMEKGVSVRIKDLVADLEARDARDSQRSVSPLKPAGNAHLLDTSFMTVNDVVKEVLSWFAQWKGSQL